MNKVITFICCCVLFMSCKEAHNNISKSESACDDTTSVKCWKSKAKEKYSRREEYYFTKGKDTLNFILGTSTNKDGLITLSMNNSFCRGNARAALPFVEQIKLVDIYIKTHLGNDSVKKIRGVVTRLIYCGDLDAEITKEYYRTRERVPIDSILFKSRIREFIDSVFSPYHLHVDKVKTEKYLLADKTVLKEHNIPVSNYDSFPSQIIEGYPYFRLTVKNP